MYILRGWIAITINLDCHASCPFDLIWSSKQMEARNLNSEIAEMCKIVVSRKHVDYCYHIGSSS